MQKSEFSEKFFEILIDHVLLCKGFNIYVPSQFKEVKLGYDALINNLKNIKGRIQAFAFQYKIVEKYDRCPANGDRFRFNLHPNHTYMQHNKLYNLNKFKKIFAGYVVPTFITLGELYSNLNSRLLLSNSLFIFPQAKITDKKSHYMSFSNSAAHQHSREQINCEIKSLTEIIANNNSDFIMSPEAFIDTLYGIEEYHFETKRLNSANESFLIAYKIVD